VLRAVIFDIDGVLLDSRAANIEFYRAFLARNGYAERSDDELAQGHYMNLREAIATLTRETSEARIDQLWEGAKVLEGYPMDLTQVPDGCEAVLTQLSQRYFLAVVTSRHRLGIEHFYATSGLESLLSVSIAFEDYERPKPAPDPLLTACRRLGVSPDEAVYVGDAEVDVLCAAAAGTGFIAYGPAIEQAPLRALSFADIPGLLAAV